MKNLHVIIAGAGPAGLTLGLILEQKSIKYTIIEGVREDQLCSDVGGGYDLGDNALKIYDQFGLGKELRDLGTKFSSVKSYNSKGELKAEIPLPASSELTSIRRSTLQKVIIGKLSTNRIIFGSKVADVKENENEVIAILENGTQIKGDFLVAADGVHSAVRRSVFKDGPATHVGVSCLWGQVNWSNLPANSMEKFNGAAMLIGKGQTFIAGHLGNQMIWTAFWQDEKFVKSETKHLAKDNVVKKLLSWNREMAEIAKLSSVEKLAEAGIYDRPPAKSWHSTITVLIGDAAHPMTPFLGLGANTAIADAFVLGYQIEKGSSIDEIFSAFEKRRKIPVEKKVKSARTVCEYSLSKTKWKNWLMLNGMALLPKPLLKKMILSGDNVNEIGDLID